MATIRTAIELYDAFSAPLMNVIQAVNQGVSAMETMHATMNEPVSVSIADGIAEQMNQAVQAIEEARSALSEPVTHENTSVTWDSPTMPTFTNSGVERFEQEVQSANNMLNTLNQTQRNIAAQAERMQLFPSNMVNDMNTMQSRIQGIQERIQTIENNPLNLGTDQANAELEYLRNNLNQAVQTQNEMNAAIQNMDITTANDAYIRLSNTISGTERYIRDNVDEQGRFNREIQEGVAQADNLMDSIKGLVAAYATVQTMGSIIELSDTVTQTTARLELIVDDGGSVEELQNKIFASAQASRGSYLATADAVYKLGAQASQAFNSSDEIIAFTELLNKQFTIAGTEVQGIDAAMLQLTQAMGSGVLRGEEYNSILEQAPNIIQAIADYMEVPKGQLKDMAAEGLITAAIVKAAMFAAAVDTNAKFEQMPKTFSQIWTSFQNTALMAFQPVLERLNELANSTAFQNMVNGAIEALAMVAGIVLEIFDLIAAVGGFIAENWSIIEPIIMGIVTALGLYYGAMLLYNTITGISTAITAAKAFMEKVHAASLAMEAGTTFAVTAAQYGFNAALLACPITWIIILIIALIALFYAAVAAVNKFAGTSVSATGIICGAFMVALAFIGNIFVALWNLVVDVFVLIYNLVATVANFIGNVFTDPIGAVCRLFFDLADTVLGILQALASAIDAIFGSNLAGSVQGWRDSLGGWVDETFGKGNEVMAKMDADSLKLGRFEYGAAWDAGYSFGEGIDESIANFDPSSLFDTNVPGAGDYADLSNYGAGLAGDVGDIAGNTGAIKDSMDITEEDLKYLRDIAEQEAINRFTTAEINIEAPITNQISKDVDLDGVVDGLTGAVNEAVDIIAEGVHE